MSLPTSMQAVKVVEAKKAEVKEVPLPKMRDDYVLVKVAAVAVNPTDWKHVDFMSTENATVGCDLSGTVVEIGKNVPTPLKQGQRVAGMAHGVNNVQPEDGAFADYALVKGTLVMPLTDKTSNEDAATLGVGVFTVGQAVYQRMGIPLPPAKPGNGRPLLVYGGSTATGLWALQFAKLSGFEPIAVCSARNFDLVKSYGASAAFDYKDSDCGAKIREHTQDKLEYAFDTIADQSSVKICAEALTSTGNGKYNSLMPVEFPREDVAASYTLAYSVVGEFFQFRGGREFEANPADAEQGAKVAKLVSELLAEGKLKIIPSEVRDGGLKGTIEGMDDLRQGKVSGKKIVYDIA